MPTRIHIPSTPHHPRRSHSSPLLATLCEHRVHQTVYPLRDILPHLQAQYSIPEECPPATRLLTRCRKVSFHHARHSVHVSISLNMRSHQSTRLLLSARTTPLPTIHELTYLWSFLPESGPPLPRTRNPKASTPKPPDTPQPTTQLTSPPRTFFARLFAWLLTVTTLGKIAGEEVPTRRKPHPFAVLKGGKKTVVIGIVDNGTVGFFRFGMGAFEEIPMV